MLYIKCKCCMYCKCSKTVSMVMAGFFMITIIATVKVEQSLQLPVSVWSPQYLQNKKCCNCRNNDVTAFWYLSLQRLLQSLPSGFHNFNDCCDHHDRTEVYLNYCFHNDCCDHNDCRTFFPAIVHVAIIKQP